MPKNTPTEIPNDKVEGYKKHIIRQLNEWQDLLVNRTAEFRDSMMRRKLNPTKVIKTGSGDLSMTSIAEIRMINLIEARERVHALEEMLAAVEVSDEKLAELWSNDALTIEPDARIEGDNPTITPFGTK